MRRVYCGAVFLLLRLVGIPPVTGNRNAPSQRGPYDPKHVRARDDVHKRQQAHDDSVFRQVSREGANGFDPVL